MVNHRVVDERKALEDELIHRAFHDSLTGLANRGQLRGRVVKASVGVKQSARAAVRCSSSTSTTSRRSTTASGTMPGTGCSIEVSDRLEALRPGGGPGRAPRWRRIRRPSLRRAPTPVTWRRHRTAGHRRAGRSPSRCQVTGHACKRQHRHRRVRGHGGRRRLAADAGRHRDVPRQGEREEPVRPLHRRDAAGRPAPPRHGVVVAGGAGGAASCASYYQPIVELGQRKVEAVEALVRWQHPTLGLLAPDEFLDVAEETGLIVPLGQAGAARRLRADPPVAGVLRREPDGQREPLRRSAAGREHRRRVRWRSREAGVAPDALMIEVTEGALIGDVRGATAVLESLSALGVTIAIDDFGTGYSSLSHLQLFPVDVIKVDKTFVEDLCGGTEHSMLVRRCWPSRGSSGCRWWPRASSPRSRRSSSAVSGATTGRATCTPTQSPRPGSTRLLGLTPALRVG